jgi:pimeloyl-ACP methyl ester carboxylesterase
MDVPQSELDDLRARLRATRWPVAWPAHRQAAGQPPDELRRLVTYWAGGFDWRAQEAAINALPSHVAEVAGTDLHYLRFDGADGSLPIVLTHGWPSSVLELVPLARLLAQRSFTVIVPSLPGFAFSPQRPELPSDPQTHVLWHRLMRETLGFERYAAHGGDLGAGLTAKLAEAYPKELAGIHVLAVAGPADLDPASLTDQERKFLDRQAAWDEAEGAYEHQQMTRPATLSYGLADSPAGLLAWLLEKYRAWSERPLPDDYVLTQASLYWFTNTVSTSFRPYWEYAQGFTRRIERVTVPTAVAVFPHDLADPPRSWAERTYHVTRFTRMPCGGHFAAFEEPALLADDITEFFAPLR